MRTRSLIALAAVLALAGCSGGKPKPTGAGSTAVLRLMRDWRGVWTGHVKDSPMGGMPYTLYVDEGPEGIVASSAPMRESDLDNLKHTWLLVHFDHGTPQIEFTLTQRAKTQKGTVVYREDLSADDEAVFCAAEPGCDKVRLSVTQTGEKSLTFKSRVDEAAHAEFSLSFARREIPKERGGEQPDKPDEGVKKPSKASRRVDEDGHPLDQDVMLQEHQDQDVGAVDDDAGAKDVKKDKKGKK